MNTVGAVIRGSEASGAPSRPRSIGSARLAWINPGWLVVLGCALLSLIGIVTIGMTEPALAMRQAALLGIGLGAAGVLALPHYRWLRHMSVPFMILVIGLLIFVLIPYVPESIVRPRNGARRWIDLPGTTMQPSELAKIAFILALASYLRYRKNHRRFTGLLLPFVLTLIPVGLILIEPDLGTALLFVPTLFAMLIAAGAKLKHLVLIIALGIGCAPLAYPVLQPHQKDRILALYYQLKGDTRHTHDIGFQGAKARTLVGAGGWTGVGADKARDLVHYNRLPEEHNDMIFAVIVCRWGLLGGLAVWCLFGLVCGGALLTSAACRDPFGRLVCVGIAAILFAQMFINTGMTIGILPITGMTLPFVSYGGSSLVATWLMTGLVLNVGLRRPAFLSRESFDFGEEMD